MKLKKLKTSFLGRKYYYFNQIDSTQKEIWRRIGNNNIKNGTLIKAGIQNSGIGTHGRKWYTDFSNNIAFSFYISAGCEISKIEGITIKIAEVLKEVFYNLYNIKLEIKKPNDLYYNGKKIGGILTESKISGNIVKFLVVGIGINTSQTQFNSEIENIASSIKKEFGIEVDEELIITEFCNCFENVYLERIR